MPMVADKIDPASSDALAIAACEKWQMALRMRRLASAVLDRDRETLMSYAEELEGEAEALELQAAPHQQH